MSVLAGWRVAAVLAAAGLGGSAVASPPEAGVHEVRLDPVPAADFVDSVGVNVHLSYRDTNYARVSSVRQSLSSSCVRHVRDNVPHTAGDQLTATYRDLAADGIGVLAVTGSVGRRDRLSRADRTLGWIRRGGLAPLPVEAVEGPNEWDGRGGDDWAQEVRRYQRDLAAGVRQTWGDDVVVVAPSTARSERRRALGDLSAVADVASNHDYPSGRPPQEGPTQGADARALVGPAPVWLTETGYQTSGHEQNGQPSVTRRQQAAYVPRAVVSAFARGTARTYVYELLDEPSDRADPLQFGLMDPRMRPKGAYLALSRLLCVSAGTQARWDGDPAPEVDLRATDRVHHLALRRDDGALVLLLWTDEPYPAPGEPRARTHRAVLVPQADAAALEVDDLLRPAPDRHLIPAGRPLRLDVGADVTMVLVVPRGA